MKNSAQKKIKCENYSMHKDEDLDFYLDRLPSSSNYEYSYMHKDIVTHIVSSITTHTIISLGADGIVKFWKKIEANIELLRVFRCHASPPTSLRLSQDGKFAISCSMHEKTLNIFDVVACELINILNVDFSPFRCLLYELIGGDLRVVCSEVDSARLRVFDAKEASFSVAAPMHLIETVHSGGSVVGIEYHQQTNCILSIDASGIIEYTSIEEPFSFPSSSLLQFTFKSDTDLYELARRKALPYSIRLSPSGRLFAVMSNDFCTRIYNFYTGKLTRTIDDSPIRACCNGESLESDCDEEDSKKIALKIQASERDLPDAVLQNQTIEFDQSEKFIIYPTYAGIKIASVTSSLVDKFIGFDEKLRYVNLALYQGKPKGKVVTLEMAASDNPAFVRIDEIECSLFATAYKKNRFFIVSRRNPDRETEVGGDTQSSIISPHRDIMNERIIKEEFLSNQAKELSQRVSSNAVIHTDFGDIQLELFPDKAPKAVLNFVTHSRAGYYNGLTFHRVIKDFMIQTGDPNGDGTGGNSIWEKDFLDEFHPSLKHDKPFVVSMANSGPNTNGSQFFITVCAAPWLDMKHTIFGKIIGGFETVVKISNARTNKKERPIPPIKVQDIEIRILD